MFLSIIINNTAQNNAYINLKTVRETERPPLVFVTSAEKVILKIFLP
jgi:hypothetical protein